MASKRKKSFKIKNFPYKKLLKYSQKHKLDLNILMLALLHVFIYKVNGLQNTSVGIKASGKKYSKTRACRILTDQISSVQIDPSLTFYTFAVNLKKKSVLINGSKRLSYLLSLPYFSENEKNTMQIISCDEEEGSYNYEVDLVYSEKKIIFAFKLLNNSTTETVRYANAFFNFLDDFIANEEAKIKDLELISSQEKKRLVDNFNNLDCGKAKHANIFSYFEELALKNKEDVIIEHGERRITYREALQKACYVDNLIKKQARKKQQVIVSFLPKEPNLVFSVLGTLRSENISIMIRPNYPKERIKAIFEKVCPSIIVTKSKYEKCLNLLITEIGISKKINILLIDKIDLEFANTKITKFSKPKGEYNLLSNIIFTSGSTGKQKAIMMTHKIASSYLSHGAYDVTRSNGKLRLMSFFTVEFTGFFRELLLTIFRGNALCFLPDENIRLDPALLVNWAEKNEINYLCLIADIFRGITKYAQKTTRLKKLKYLFPILGRITNDKYLHRFIVNHPNLSVSNMYGMSEMGLVRSSYKITPRIFKRLNVPDFNIYQSNYLKAIVLNKDGNVQPAGFVGEIYIHSPFIAAGYYNDKKLTKERFIPNLFSLKKNDIILKTGDFVRILENGDLEYLGRKDEQLSIRGVKVFSHDVDSYILQYSGIKECITIVKETDREGLFMAVFYTGRKKINISRLRNHLKKWLPEYAIPKYFIFLESLPLLPSRKIDRKKLLKISLKDRISENFQNPQTDLEKNIQSIWQEVLKIKRIGVKENFFNIGGDSLNVMKVYYRITSLYPKMIKSSEIFLNPTISKLAKIIEKNIGKKNRSFKKTIKGLAKK